MKKTRSEGALAGFEIANPFLSVQGFLNFFFPLKTKSAGPWDPGYLSLYSDGIMHSRTCASGDLSLLYVPFPFPC